jgi:hypothetical protein
LIRFLAQDRFGQFYHEQDNIVRFPTASLLSDHLCGIPAERLLDPHIRFFHDKNPGHLQGDELVCLTEICQENLTRAGRRMWFSDQELIRVSSGKRICHDSSSLHLQSSPALY